jgi:hypothetical protein
MALWGSAARLNHLGMSLLAKLNSGLALLVEAAGSFVGLGRQ